ELRQRPEQRPGRQRRAVAEAAKSPLEKAQRFRVLVKMPRSVEIAPREALVLVFEARREPVPLHGLMEPAVLPVEGCEQAEAAGVVRPDARRATNQPRHVRALASIDDQFLRVLSAEDRVDDGMTAKLAIDRKSFVAPAKLFQATELAEPKIGV